MALMHCPECGKEISDQATACPHCGRPMNGGGRSNSASGTVPAVNAKATSAGETILLQEHPTMLRDHPFYFFGCVLLLLAGPVLAFALHPSLGRYSAWMLLISAAGLFILLSWWVRCRCIELTVTDARSIIRSGIFSKTTNEIRHVDVRNIQIDQNFLERLLDVGEVAISSAAQDIRDIEIHGVRDPEGIADLVRVRQDEN